MSDLDNFGIDKFSFSRLVPKLGELARMPVGTTVYYATGDFLAAGNISTYCTKYGAKVSTRSMYCFDARNPDVLKKMLSVTVTERLD